MCLRVTREWGEDRAAITLPLIFRPCVGDARALQNRGDDGAMTRDEAWQLLTEYTTSESLRRHALAVEAAMRHYAARFQGDTEQWGLVGLLHDFDYERWPEPRRIPRGGAPAARTGVDEEVVGAVLSHAEWNQVEYPLDRPLRKTLFAVDELCGFIMAVAYVRPERLAGMVASGVRRKLKQRSFAARSSGRTSNAAPRCWRAFGRAYRAGHPRAASVAPALVWRAGRCLVGTAPGAAG